MNLPRRALAWLLQDRWLIGASLARVLLGTWALYFYVLHWPVRAALWGPDGLWPLERFADLRSTFAVWQLAPTPRAFDALYLLAIVIAVLFTLGAWTRLTGFLHWVIIWSLHERTPLIADGGDNIMRIALLLLVLVNTGAWGSVDALRQPAPRGLRQEVLTLLHNVGVLLVLAQLALLYLSTGLYKVMGEVWQNGTAIYYILRVEEFTWPGVAEWIYRSPYLVVFGTYGTVFFELFFLPALMARWSRYLIIAAGMAFHLGIAVIMGLVTFGWSMLALYPLLVTDGEYARLAAGARSRLRLVLPRGACAG